MMLFPMTRVEFGRTHSERPIAQNTALNTTSIDIVTVLTAILVAKNLHTIGITMIERTP